MKKSTLSSWKSWWNYDLLIGALSAIVLLIVLEVLFAVPSRWIHTSHDTVISQGASTNTNLSLSESPAFCTKEYMPVCGEDGTTYGNRCMADISKVVVAYNGACIDETPTVTEPSIQAPSIDTVIPDPITATSSYIETVTSDVDFSDTKKYHTYTNSSIGYSMSFPAYSYYQGYGARDGAAHSMAIGLKADDIASFDIAPVRVWFYRTAPASPPSDQSLSLAKGVIYVSGSGDSPRITQIVNDIFASAK